MYLTLRNAPSRSFLRPVTQKSILYAAANRQTFAPRFLSQSASCRDQASSTEAPLPRLRFPKSPRDKLAPDPIAWAAEFDRYLPHSLRKTHLDRPDFTNEAEVHDLLVKIICFFLDESCQDDPVDFLTHLAIAEGRWDAVTWVVKAVTELKPPDPVKLEDVDPFSAIQWESKSNSLNEVTGHAIWAEKITDGTRTRSIDDIVRWSPLKWVRSRSGAIGRIWQSLGSMIVTAVKSPPDQKEKIMSHVLENIAHLHHNGVIPESVYEHVPPHTPFSLCQPPVLPLLAPRIYTAISDAAVQAQVIGSETDTRSPFSFFGFSRPSARPTIHTTYGLGPEVWLELILWSCLRGPWVTDGIEILLKLKNSTLANGKQWSAIYWSNLAGQQVDDPVDITWQDKARFERMHPEKADSALVEGTVTVEVVAASIEALLNSINVGTKAGHIGWSLDAIIRKMKELKQLLGRSNQGLVGATWDSIIFRLVEAGVANPDLDPEAAEKLLKIFAVTYPGTTRYSNAPREGPKTLGAPSYIMDPSAAPLGFFHSVIWSYIKTGDQIRAVQAVDSLVTLTDSNKKALVARFFRNLKKWSENTRNTPHEVPAQFDSNLARGPDPVLNPNIPPAILAALLGLARESEAYKFGEWLLFSKDIDGPLIPEPLYDHPSIAAEVIQFGRAVGNQQLVINAINRHNESEMSMRVIEAMLETQMYTSDWRSVEDVLTLLSKEQDRDFLAHVAARLAKYVLILQKPDVHKEDQVRLEQLEAASVVFRRMVKGFLGDLPPLNELDRFHGIISVLATVGPEWQTFCNSLFSQKLLRSNYRKLENCIFEEDMRELVEGVARSRGSWDAMRLVKMWCETEKHAVPWQVSTFEYKPEPWRYRQVLKPSPSPPRRTQTSVVDVSPRVQLQGLKPPASLPLLRIVYRQASREDEELAVQATRDDGSLENDPYHADSVEVWLWATRALRNTGMKAWMIDRELGPRPVEALRPMAQIAEGDLAELRWEKKGNADFEVSPVRMAVNEAQATNKTEYVVEKNDGLPGEEKSEAVEAKDEARGPDELPPNQDQEQTSHQDLDPDDSQPKRSTTFFEQERRWRRRYFRALEEEEDDQA
ncbi:hypothetical protein HDK90DRAFT_473192 [Phyllosticta capitalensis]|uniref:Uncharacterized protein n=1 Tax=Phyllosticta capitalensis TaxID=121624 RepID=A0ABR1Z431_9PEZI